MNRKILLLICIILINCESAPVTSRLKIETDSKVTFPDTVKSINAYCNAVVISPNGIALTAYHCIEKTGIGKSIYVNNIKVESISKIDTTDLAILYLNRKTNDYIFICQTVNIGDKIFVEDISTGTLRREFGAIKFLSNTLITSSIKTENGFSGGPVIKKENGQNCLVGVHYMHNELYSIHTNVVGMSFEENNEM